MSETTLGTARTTEIAGLKTLKTPDEGGTKKEYDEFLEKVEEHIGVSWNFGTDIAKVVRTGLRPFIEEPVDLDAEEKRAWKRRLWEQAVDKYGERIAVLEDNMRALYALLTTNVSKLMKSKVRSKNGYDKANEEKDPIWLLEVVEDVMVNFEKVKSHLLAMEDQLERVVGARQKPTDSNEDFVKMVMKEIKVYEKHGGDYLWGSHQVETLKTELEKSKLAFKVNSEKDMTEEEEKQERKVLKRRLKEKILAMAIFKRADKKRFGNLQIKFANAYLVGNDNYPETAADALKLMNNYKDEWN